MADRILNEVNKSSFFTSINGDRPYSATDFVAYLGSAVGNGIIDLNDVGGTTSAPLGVGSITNYTVTINTGSALLGGNYGFLARQTSSYNIEFSPHATLDRWDRVVLVLDTQTGSRTIKFGVIEGTAGDPKPTGNTGLTQNDVTTGGIYELLLFDVLVPSSATGGPIPGANISYEYTPYVQYESKTNKAATMGASSPTVKYPSLQAVIDYSLPLSGGASFPMTGDLYMTNGNIFNLQRIVGPSDTPVVIEGSGNTTASVKIKPAGFVGDYSVLHTYLSSLFLNRTTFDDGATLNAGSDGNAIVANANAVFFGGAELYGSIDINGTINTDVTFDNTRLIGARTENDREIASKPLIVYEAGPLTSGIKIGTYTDDPAGYTFTTSTVDDGQATYMRISFAIKTRDGSSPYNIDNGITTVLVDWKSLITTFGDSDKVVVSVPIMDATASPTKDTSSGAGLTGYILAFTVQRFQSSKNTKIWAPVSYQFFGGAAFTEEEIWIHKVEVIY